jgi:hypothetical protein
MRRSGWGPPEKDPHSGHLAGGPPVPDHATHEEQASMIRRYIIWRNNHAYDERLRHIVARANVA